MKLSGGIENKEVKAGRGKKAGMGRVIFTCWSGYVQWCRQLWATGARAPSTSTNLFFFS